MGPDRTITADYLGENGEPRLRRDSSRCAGSNGGPHPAAGKPLGRPSGDKRIQDSPVHHMINDLGRAEAGYLAIHLASQELDLI